MPEFSNLSDTDEADGRGRQAHKPTQIPFSGWLDIAWRIYHRIESDQVFLIAGGVTFYFLLSIFPALGAYVAIFGYFADVNSIAEQLESLTGIVPEGGLEIIRRQLLSLADQNRNVLSIGFVIAFAVAFWTANAGVKALFQALNIAYDETEKRSFLKINLIAFAFTLGTMATTVVLVAFVGVVPAVLALLPLGNLPELIIGISRWPILLLLSGLAISILYRYGPSRHPAKWRWISWGGSVATLVWLLTSAGFSFYLQNFADYNATYGSLGAIVGFLLWTWISTVILLIGAEFNAELEHQTSRDSTIGPPRPMGERGAVMADTIGRSLDSKNAASEDSSPRERR